jgi:Domain of unknown function (DUF222)
MDKPDPRYHGESPDDDSAPDSAPAPAQSSAPAGAPVPKSAPTSTTAPGAGADAAAGDPDPEWTEYTAWRDREVAAGRDPEPEFCEPDDGDPIDPLELEADFIASGPMAGRMMFAQYGAADLLPPGPVLVGLTDNVVNDVSVLSDDELVGLLQVSRRQVAHEQYKQVLVIAEFARRRQAAFTDAASRGIPVGCRPGEFPGDELAIEMVTTPIDAGHKIDDAIDLISRLPRTLAGMAAGLIDADRAGWISFYTRSLSPADAAYADEVLAAAAPDLRVEQLARKAAALEKKFNPGAVKARRERARRCNQRVEVRPELSGNASLSGREMDTADVLASKAHIDAIAAQLRRGGLPGTLGSLRVLAMTDLTQGRDPLHRLHRVSPEAPHPADLARQAPPGPADPQAQAPADPQPPGPAAPQSPGPADPQPPGPGGPSAGPGFPPGRAPLPALVNVIIPVGTLLGWSTTPGLASGWGLLDYDEARTIAEAAATHPRTRWCATLTAPDGTALAHACATGQHRSLLRDPQPQAEPPQPQAEPPQPQAQPPPAGQVTELLRRLGLAAFTPIARGSCDHAQAETTYTPSRKLRHLVRARNATCDAPGCTAEAIHADLDHTHPWPDGPTDECNLAPRCRTHHRAKQAPDWTAQQTAPGVTRWTLPSGRTHTTTPTQYDI